jgi:septal ring factor EnvC (AmiA/AmiB activator)
MKKFIGSASKKTTKFSVFDKKGLNTRLSKFLKARSLQVVNDCFKKESNAVVGVFLQRLGSIIFIIFVFGHVSSGQTIEDLRKERESLLEEIATTNRLIQIKKENRKDNLSELNLIERDISAREKLLDNYRKEINQLDRHIEVNQMLVNDLEKDIQRLKDEYAKILRDSYRRKGNLNELMYFFSSDDFGEAYLRYRIIQEYGRYRQRQGEELIESQIKVRSVLQEIQQQRSEKEAFLSEVESELSKLQSSRERKTRLIQKLQTEQQWLQKSLKEKQAAANALENRIHELIAAESNKSVDAAESSHFADQMGKLIWPVKNGVIVNPFGEHRHPVLRDVTIKNNGIDIQPGNMNFDVFCVHQGVVSTVVAIRGLNKVVIIRHGKFLTVYGNLLDVLVSKGDIVSAGQLIGKISNQNTESKEVLYFEIREEGTKLDPEQWLLR